MKRETLLKLLVILMTGVILFAMSANVFAAVSDPDAGLDFFQDITDPNVSTPVEDEKPENVVVEDNKPVNNTNDTNNTNNTNNYNTNLPKAGATENTIAGIAITLLAITAIYAYRKVNEYKNI